MYCHSGFDLLMAYSRPATYGSVVAAMGICGVAHTVMIIMTIYLLIFHALLLNLTFCKDN